MRYLLVLFSFVISLAFIPQNSFGDFAETDKPTFSFNGSGIQNLGNWNLSGIIPLKAINGKIGVRYLHDEIPDEETTRTHLRARLNGGWDWGKIGLQIYTRYGRESVMLQKGLYHGGFNFEIDFYENEDFQLFMSLGVWTEQQELLEEYVNMPDTTDIMESEDNIDFGPQIHLTLKDKYWVLNSALLLNADKTYQIRNFFDIEYPLFKVLFIDEVSLAVSGYVDYYSATEHLLIDNLQWSWHHQVRFKF